MRYYLDTNILAFLLLPDATEELTAEVIQIIFGYEDLLMTSTVCVHELIHLLQIGKLSSRGYRQWNAENVMQHLKDYNIQIVPITEHHLQTYAALPLYENHRDPNDRLIVAQAIADRLPVISSDRKFTLYVKHGLDFIFNER